MKWSKELLTKPCHWHNMKYPFINYLQLFTQEGPAEPEEAHGASSDARPRTPRAEGQWEEPNRCVPWTQTCMNSTGAVLGMLLTVSRALVNSKTWGFGKTFREIRLSEIQAKSLHPKPQLPDVSQSTSKILLRWKSYFFSGLYVLSLSAVFSHDLCT